LSKKLYSQKNFDRNFKAVERVIGARKQQENNKNNIAE